MGKNEMLEPARWLIYAAVYLTTPADAFADFRRNTTPRCLVSKSGVLSDAFSLQCPPHGCLQGIKIVNVNRARSYGEVLGLLEGCHAMNKAREKL
jgi:hypothetical protein